MASLNTDDWQEAFENSPKGATHYLYSLTPERFRAREKELRAIPEIPDGLDPPPQSIRLRFYRINEEGEHVAVSGPWGDEIAIKGPTVIQQSGDTSLNENGAINPAIAVTVADSDRRDVRRKEALSEKKKARTQYHKDMLEDNRETRRLLIDFVKGQIDYKDKKIAELEAKVESAGDQSFLGLLASEGGDRMVENLKDLIDAGGKALGQGAALGMKAAMEMQVRKKRSDGLPDNKDNKG